MTFIFNYNPKLETKLMMLAILQAEGFSRVIEMLFIDYSFSRYG